MGGMESHLIHLRSRSVLLHCRIQNEPDVLSLLRFSCFTTEQVYQEKNYFYTLVSFSTRLAFSSELRS